MQLKSIPRREIGLVVLALAAWLWPKPEAATTATARRVFAVVAPGPNADGLAAAGLLAPLLAATDVAWVGADALVIPGARGAALGRRLHTGKIVAPRTAPDLLSAAGFESIGSWESPSPTVAADVERFALRQRQPTGKPGHVLYLGCAWSTPTCSAAAQSAVATILAASAAGDVGILLSIPPAGAPARGAIWVGGDDIDPQAALRFRLIDFAPMLLHLTDQVLPADIDGTPALELWREDARFRHPPRFVGGRP